MMQINAAGLIGSKKKPEQLKKLVDRLLKLKISVAKPS
jgi:hypothetical protein